MLGQVDDVVQGLLQFVGLYVAGDGDAHLVAHDPYVHAVFQGLTPRAAGRGVLEGGGRHATERVGLLDVAQDRRQISADVAGDPYVLPAT